MAQEMKTLPPYAVASVDHALRVATMLQLEGDLTVTEVAERLSVARSTAHRLLAMLVYRDFAVKDESRRYHAGPVLELLAHSRFPPARLRVAALPHLKRVVETLRESANLGIRTGDTSRFIASVECDRSLRVGSREGMVFPVAQTCAGMLALAAEATDDPVLTQVRRQGFVVNPGRSEKGVVAVGVPVRDSGVFVAGLAVSMPKVRYHEGELPRIVTVLQAAARDLEADLRPPKT